MPGFDSAMSTFASLSALPLPIILPIPLFALFTGAYLVAAPYFPTEKQRAYILSTFTSAAMTLMSLPFVWNYLAHGFRVSHEEAQGGWRWDLALFGVILFGTYLFGEPSTHEAEDELTGIVLS